MATQTVYNENMRRGVAGQIVDQIPKTLISRTVENAAGMGFGIPAAQGAKDKGIRPFQAGDTIDAFVGFTVRERSLHAEADAFKQYDSARLMTKGALWVVASVAVAAKDKVYIVPATGVLTNVATSNLLVPGARWDTSTTAANQIAQVRLG